MVEIKPDEISAILRQQLSNYNVAAELEEVDWSGKSQIITVGGLEYPSVSFACKRLGKNYKKVISRIEPPRVLRRLRYLRQWSHHEQNPNQLS